MSKVKVLRNKIPKILKTLNRSQGWLSRETKIEVHHVNKIIRGRHHPQLITAFKIAKALRCRVDDIWKY